jgi:hypothetical protein
MNYKKIVKINFSSVIFFIIIFSILYFLLGHAYCKPIYIMGGALLESGSYGGGLHLPCGFISRWMWKNEILYNLNNWQILIISLILAFLINLVINLIRARK